MSNLFLRLFTSARPWRLPRTEIIVGLAFFAMALGALVMTRVNGGIALLWPANAVAGALLIRAKSVRPLSAAVILLTASGAVNMTAAHRAWPIALALSSCNIVQIGLMVWAFRSFKRYNYPAINIEQAAIMTALFGIVIPGISALGAGLVLHRYYGVPVGQGILQWWGSHTLGACLFGPPIILWSSKSLRRLASTRYLALNLATLLAILLGCFVAVRYIRFPFAVMGALLMTAAFRVGGFGASLLSLCSGLTIAALWAFGVRPEGLELTPLSASLAGLPVIALLATTLPPIAVGLGTDARRAAVRRLNLSERRFHEAMDHSPIGMLIADLNGIWGYTNLALQTMLGYTGAEFAALPPGGPSEPDAWTTSAARWKPLLSGAISSYDVERRFRHKDGHWIWTHVAVSAVRGEDGSPLFLIAQIESLEARRHAEAKLDEERRRLRITLESIDDAVITTDAQSCITYINNAAAAMLGSGGDALQGRQVNEVIHLTDPQTSKAAANLIGQGMVHGTVVRRPSACILHRPDGSFTFVTDVVSPVIDSSGIVTGMVIVLRDASGDVSRGQELTHRASHDAMTDLANRFEFKRLLTETFVRSTQLDQPAGVLAIDLDRFKAVNDCGGHAAGDAVLRRVADLLRTTVRRSDVIARLGGDEFAVILPNCPEARCIVLAERILRVINPVEVQWKDNFYSVGASVGLAMLDPHFKDIDEWLAAADQACYRAKREGRHELHTVERRLRSRS